jgi:hypothetical protein
MFDGDSEQLEILERQPQETIHLALSLHSTFTLAALHHR